MNYPSDAAFVTLN